MKRSLGTRLEIDRALTELGRQLARLDAGEIRILCGGLENQSGFSTEAGGNPSSHRFPAPIPIRVRLPTTEINANNSPCQKWQDINGARIVRLFLSHAGAYAHLMNLLILTLGLLSIAPLHASDLASWAGQWTMEHSSPVFKYSIRFEPQGKDLKFQMEAYSGTHSGSIEGIAKLQSPNQAVWREEHRDIKPPFVSEVVFTKQGDQISVSAKNTQYYGGAGISFDEGTYLRGPAKEDPYPLVSHALLTREEEDRVRKLAGEDYPLVVTCLQLARVDEVQEKDFRGKVVDGFVRGAAPYMNARITIETDG
ncbi:hypothetical protein EBT23_07570, partial [bacterium]|nr:hypothetical protein [bacterium]